MIPVPEDDKKPVVIPTGNGKGMGGAAGGKKDEAPSAAKATGKIINGAKNRADVEKRAADEFNKLAKDGKVKISAIESLMKTEALSESIMSEAKELMRSINKNSDGHV